MSGTPPAEAGGVSIGVCRIIIRTAAAAENCGESAPGNAAREAGYKETAVRMAHAEQR